MISKIIIRADASQILGSGHIMRCLTLASALKDKGAEVEFICRAHTGHLAEKIRQAGFACHLWPCENDTILGSTWPKDAAQTRAMAQHAKADWVIVDHYALDAKWEIEIAKAGCKIMVIDDLTDRPHICDVLLNQNLGASAEDYATLVPDNTLVLAGSKYAMLRPEFAALRDQSLARRALPIKGKRNILVSMGGADLPNATARILDLLAECADAADWTVTVVMGGQAPHLNVIKAKAKKMPFDTKLVVDTPDMAQLMTDADIAIGAAGSTSWERCCLGLPSLIVVLADNQRLISQNLENAGAAFMMSLGAKNEKQVIDAFLKTIPETGPVMSQRAAQITDGSGVHHIVNTLMSLSV